MNPRYRYEIRDGSDLVVFASDTIVEANIWLKKYRAPGDTVWDTASDYEVKI